MAYTLSELQDLQKQILLGNDPAYKIQDIKPKAPENVVATGERGLIRMQWAPSENAEGYRVAVMTDQNLENPNVGLFGISEPKQLEFVYNCGNNELARYFAVQSYAGSEYSEFSPIVSATSSRISGSLLTNNFATDTHTGDTNETILKTATIPAGTLGTSGGVRFRVMGSYTYSSGTMTLRVRWGGIGGTVVAALSPTAVSTRTFVLDGLIFNQGATNSQVGDSWGLAATTSAGATQQIAASVTSSSQDTTADVDLVVTVKLGVGGDSATANHLLVETIAGISDSVPASPPANPPSSSEPPSYDPSERGRLSQL